MQRMNGIELTAELKRTPALAGIPIVVITGDVIAGGEAVARGASFMLRKPVEVDEVVAAVKRFGGQPRRAAA
jgi:CheY-like chemotaxis protein